MNLGQAMRNLDSGDWRMLLLHIAHSHIPEHEEIISAASFHG